MSELRAKTELATVPIWGSPPFLSSERPLETSFSGALGRPTMVTVEKKVGQPLNK